VIRRCYNKLKSCSIKTVVRPPLLHGYIRWPLSPRNEIQLAMMEINMVRWGMGVSFQEHRRNDDILNDADVESIDVIARRSRLSNNTLYAFITRHVSE